MARSRWGMTPRESVLRASERLGRDAVVHGCIDLLDGGWTDPDLVVAVGGPPASWVHTGQPPGPDYWLRVWGARGLLHVWDDAAGPAVVRALGDAQWRVREMALRVVARHGVLEAADDVARLLDDDTARVRAAAVRAQHALDSLGS